MNTKIVRFSRTLAVALLVLLAGFSIAAPSSIAQSFRGLVRGSITDAHSLVIPGAKITARNLGTSETREVTSDSEGVYFFLELPTGEYEVAAIAPGFQEVRAPHVIVNVGEATVVDFKLAKPTEKVEQVVVSANVPLLETASTTLSQVVDRQLVQELPLNGRDFGKLVALAPGVTVEGSGVSGSEKGFGQFNINGNRDRSNNYMLDGTDNNDPFINNSALNQVGISGAPATLLPLDAIQEFNLQAQFGAEYGRNSGAVVNIITRSGTNSLHGSLYEYNRNSYFDARNFFNTSPNSQSRFNNNNFGGSLGGPVIKDRTFFFGAYEGQREAVGSDFNLIVPRTGATNNDIQAAEQVALTQTIVPLKQINPALVKILDFFPANPTNSNAIANSVRDKNNGDNFIVKLDHKLSAKNMLSGRYAFGQNAQEFPFGSLGGFGSGSRISSFAQASPTRVQVISTSLLTTLSPTKLNELRFGYSRFRVNFTSIDQLDPTTLGNGFNLGNGKLGLPEIDFNGDIENLGTTGFSVPRGRTSETFQVLDNFTWIRGRHTVKFGSEYHRYDVQSFNDNLERGILQINTRINDGTGNFVALDPNPVVNELANFFVGNIFALALTGNTSRFTFNNNISFFGQDDIRLRPNVTLNLGLRWEYFGPLGEKHNLLSNFDAAGNLVQVGSPTLPHVYNRDLNNFGPHLGVAWHPRHDTVVRAAYGLYYDYIPQNILIANFTNSAGVATNPASATNPKAISVPVNGFDFNSSVWNGTVTGPIYTPTAFSQSIFITDRNLRTPYVQSWSLNIQQQINESVALEVGYVGTKGTRLTRLYDKNQDFTNPNYFQIAVLSTGANSTYNALQTTVRFNNWHRFSGFSTYSWSKSLDGASDGLDFNGGTAAFPQNSDNLPAEKGPSTFDTRHRWTSALNYRLPAISHLPRRLADGWQLNSIISVQSGRPIPIINQGGGSNSHGRPDIIPRVNPILSHWSPTTGYLNPLAFKDPVGTFGNLGRDQVFGPGFWNVDFSVSKTTKLTEALALQFRAEFFNIFNHPNFALPSNHITPAFFSDGTPKPLNPPACNTLVQCYAAGLITQTPDVAQGNPGLGGGGPRVMQFGLRLQF
ncbi:MAG TPA: TonB-dependent receptor [Candidatus Acidoferrum sp.]|nr:TonB-dependent receptor [Candidatus Acidoferrum sp.]